MGESDPLLDELAAAISDGAAIDWASAASAPMPPAGLVPDRTHSCSSRWPLIIVRPTHSAEVTAAAARRPGTARPRRLGPSASPRPRRRAAPSASSTARGTPDWTARSRSSCRRPCRARRATPRRIRKVACWRESATPTSSRSTAPSDAGTRSGCGWSWSTGARCSARYGGPGVSSARTWSPSGSNWRAPLSAVHDAGLVHGDVKAQNVMLADDGRVVLMDFGTGHDIAPGRRLPLGGTPLYLAPERLRGEPASVRSDSTRSASCSSTC